MSKTVKTGEERAVNKVDEEVLGVVKELIKGIYGDPGYKLLMHIIEHGYVAEELLTHDTGIKSNEGRKILQKMSEENIVIPGKLRTQEGVLHIWRLNPPALKNLLLQRLRKTREKLVLRLNFEEENILYECPQCGRRYTLDEAYANDYICPVDGEVLVEADKSKTVEVLKELISKVDNLIKRVERV